MKKATELINDLKKEVKKADFVYNDIEFWRM